LQSLYRFAPPPGIAGLPMASYAMSVYRVRHTNSETFTLSREVVCLAGLVSEPAREMAQEQRAAAAQSVGLGRLLLQRRDHVAAAARRSSGDGRASRQVLAHGQVGAVVATGSKVVGVAKTAGPSGGRLQKSADTCRPNLNKLLPWTGSQRTPHRSRHPNE